MSAELIVDTNGLALRGRLDADGAAMVWAQARSAVTTRCVVDASAVEYCDGAGTALLFDLIQRGARIDGLPERYAALLADLQPDKPLILPEPKPHGIGDEMAAFGQAISSEFRLTMAFVGVFTADIARIFTARGKIRWRNGFAVASSAGADALPIVALVAFLFGVILSFQSAVPMRQFGAELFVADLVGLSLVRELAPLMTAILLAGRTGAAFAAELGTMKVNEEINALITLGLDPFRFLVIPRLLAVALIMPMLTICAEVIGLAGMAMVMATFDVPFATSLSRATTIVSLSDFFGGLGKSMVFGFFIAAIGCLRGLRTGAGAAAVGESTTRAVVSSIVMLVVVDGLFAVVFYILGW
ncbi:glycoprotein endopeptidase metalloprotease [Jeongeupia sp. HS-3]|uniref:ABC transporter permease n=1 Tax=Jeongeupia sp. HS-3 TaxID=1009682 RepID=UPI0018A50766|nr:ABC transporter permease [Jeongeupia sp. HS-3]BCL74454.1 glycoprotein endopeptidase metalloprotease [Jeongeupia sp. HS-3]